MTYVHVWLLVWNIIFCKEITYVILKIYIYYFSKPWGCYVCMCQCNCIEFEYECLLRLEADYVYLYACTCV